MGVAWCGFDPAERDQHLPDGRGWQLIGLGAVWELDHGNQTSP